MDKERTEFKLKALPEDAVSAIHFAPSSSQSHLLLASSWDTHCRLYDVSSNTLRHKYSHNGHPVLDSYFKDTTLALSGGLDGSILGYDFESETYLNFGNHSDAVRCINYSDDKGIVVSGSWDTFVKLWDHRSKELISSHNQMEQSIYAMDVQDEVLVVGTDERKVIVWDLRNMSAPLQQRDSILKYQTRCIRIFPDKKGFVLSSIEGRVGVEYFDTSVETQKKRYAFKCHRLKEDGIECIYPVNAIGFHSAYSTFATGGSDGFVNIWDGFKKKRLCQFHRYTTGISSLSFSYDGSLLAIACSYMYENDVDPNPMPEDAIYIRNVTDQETKPK